MSRSLSYVYAELAKVVSVEQRGVELVFYYYCLKVLVRFRGLDRVCFSLPVKELRIKLKNKELRGRRNVRQDR